VNPGDRPSRLPGTSWRTDLVLLALIFGTLLGWRLGSAPLINPDEPRYAEVPREMLASGDWVTPRLDGVPYFEKPPLMYWVVAALEKTLGDGEWSVRLAPALFALAGVLMTYAAARRIYGRDAGFWAAIVLGTSLLYLGLGRMLLLDTAVSVLMSATLFCFIAGVRERPGARRRGLFYGLYATAALATLTKGLMGFLLAGAVMFLWLLLCGQWRRLRPLYFPSGLALFLLIAAPWHLLAAARNPGWAHFYFVHEHWERFTTSAGHGRYQPAWFFIPIVLLGLFPWTGFLWCSFRDALAGGWPRRRDNAEAWFFAIWAAFIFVFFSASQSKLIPYILPVFPPIAVMTGRWVAAALREADAFARMRPALRIFGFLCGIIAAGLCVAVLRPGLVRDPAQAAALRPYAFVLASILCVGGMRALVPRGAAGAARGAVIAMTATLVFVIGVLSFAMPLIDIRSTKELALAATGLVRPGDRVYHYHGYFQDFTYYSGHLAGLVRYSDELELRFLDPAQLKERFIDDDEFQREWAGPGRVFAVAKIGDAMRLFSDPAFRYFVVRSNPHYYLFSNQP
jgi:4-amino-4-deoxy-L-arabinose transferase-like glycosyltransferase